MRCLDNPTSHLVLQRKTKAGVVYSLKTKMLFLKVRDFCFILNEEFLALL